MNTDSYRRLYNAVILPMLWGGSRVLALANKKVCAGLSGRRGLVERARRFRERIGGRPVLLFHCASAGELEALKPIAAEFNRERIALAVSYFSPSAQTALRDDTEFDFADFSPIDSAAHVRSYFEAIQPSVIAITKHDVWPNFAWTARDLDIPLFLINGNFPVASARLRPGARGFHAAVYSAFREIMAVSDEDAERARRIVGDGVKIVAVGDARFDR
ncbi:hypothetical protein KKH27_08190, partial [bacterium]|nr:hypothetical protein [bacterium]